MYLLSQPASKYIFSKNNPKKHNKTNKQLNKNGIPAYDICLEQNILNTSGCDMISIEILYKIFKEIWIASEGLTCYDALRNLILLSNQM